MNCIFCALSSGDLPSFKIYEDDVVIACLDVNPFAAGHVLVMPKVHAATLLETPDDVLKEVIVRVKKIAEHVCKTLGCDGFNILQNNGAAAGQTVRHLHFHIVPRRTGDALSFENHEGDQEALKALAAKLCMTPTAM